jgi:Fe-S-cluster containining protein
MSGRPRALALSPAAGRTARVPTDGDCTSCGACCANPDENRAENFVDYIEVLPRDPLLTKTRKSGKNSKSLTRLIVYNPEGRPHMRLDDRGTCVALRGKLGERVQCTIYADRPTGCRRVVAGSERCLLARRERGVVDVL